MTLMNVFDMFDVNSDGLLERDEVNFFNVCTGDEELRDEDWTLLQSHFHFRDSAMPLKAFLDMHQMEADSFDDAQLTDMWTSLLLLGYNRQLSLVSVSEPSPSEVSDLPLRCHSSEWRPHPTSFHPSRIHEGGAISRPRPLLLERCYCGD